MCMAFSCPYTGWKNQAPFQMEKLCCSILDRLFLPMERVLLPTHVQRDRIAIIQRCNALPTYLPNVDQPGFLDCLILSTRVTPGKDTRMSTLTYPKRSTRTLDRCLSTSHCDIRPTVFGKKSNLGR